MYYNAPGSMSTRGATTATAAGWTDAVYAFPDSASGLGLDIYMVQIGANAVGNAATTWIGVAAQMMAGEMTPVEDVTLWSEGLCSAGTGNVSAVISCADNSNTRVSGLSCADVQFGHQENSAKTFEDLLLTFSVPVGTNVSGVNFMYLVLAGEPSGGDADIRAAQTFTAGSVAMSTAVSPPTPALTRFYNEQCMQVTDCPTFSATWVAVCTTVDGLLNPSSPASALMASFAAVAFALFF